jgi:hypothetical protein
MGPFVAAFRGGVSWWRFVVAFRGGVSWRRFVAAFRGGVSWRRSDRLALAIDPALKGKETTAIVISVVCRGCAIPVARRIMRANKPGAWMDPVVELLQAAAPAAPEEMKVIVLCGRGLTSPELWEQIRARSLPPATTGGLASIHEVP